MSRQLCALCSMMQNEDMSNHFRRIDDSDSILFFLFLSLFMQKPYPTKLGKYFWGAAYPVVRTARPSLSCKTTHTQAMLERHFSRSLLRSFLLDIFTFFNFPNFLICSCQPHFLRSPYYTISVVSTKVFQGNVNEEGF